MNLMCGGTHDNDTAHPFLYCRTKVYCGRNDQRSRERIGKNEIKSGGNGGQRNGNIKKNYWIWNHEEYEIYHFRKLSLRRQEFGVEFPPFWKLPSTDVSVKFVKEFTCEGGYLMAHTNGRGYLMVDEVRWGMDIKISLTPGFHTVSACIFKEDGLPALYVDSDVCPSDESWLCNHCAGDFLPVGCEEYFDSPTKDPEIFPFLYERKDPLGVEVREKGLLYDFGDEWFGYLNIRNANPEERMGVFYGESVDEALDTEHSILLEQVQGQGEYRLRQRAFRYVYLETISKDLAVSMDQEYLPLEQKGTFSCERELYNQIYAASVHTFHLNCRECFLDGIKRDRWVWAGDAYQSARINAYLFADPSIVERTAIGLYGKEPVEQHVNTIIDYSFYWMIGLYEYYMTYGGKSFLERMYPKAERLMEFCEKRINSDGFVVGIAGDWTFIDWSEMDKTGAVCAEQMLFAAAYDALAHIAGILGKDDSRYAAKCDILKERIQEFYWDKELGAFIDSYESGKKHVTRHANIFAIMYDIATPLQQQSIVKHVLKNDRITRITTPYFKGYELDVLGKVGEFTEIEAELDSYWGGMLALGATTIWEEFDPHLKGTEHYAMYGNKYAKSLCHAWGAGPIYLFGRYYLGVYPTGGGYETFCVEPNPGGLKRISGTVPINGGEVRVALEQGVLRVMATKAGGTLRWRGKEYQLMPNVEIVTDGDERRFFS